MCTGSDRPALRDLNYNVVKQAAHKWRDIRVVLEELGKINVIADHDDDVSCFRAVLYTWLQTSPDASWYQLIRALRSPTVQLDSLADQLEKMLNTKCKIYSNITTNCTL